MYDPSISNSYQYIEQSRFQVSYIDNSMIQGYIAHEVIKMGNLNTSGYFGVITNITGIWVGSGILGIGFPQASNVLGKTILFQNSDSQHIFSMVLDNKIGELQIGGYIEEAIDPFAPTMIEVDILPECTEFLCAFEHYRIPVDGIRVGSQFIVQGETDLSAVLDSGTTCLIVPGGHNDTNIYELMLRAFEAQDSASLFISIQGHEFEITHEQLTFLQHEKEMRDRLCVLSIEAYPDLFILGDTFMRTVLSIYNLTNLERPTVALAKRNPAYPQEYSRKLATSSITRHEMTRDLRLGGGLKELNTSLIRVPLKHAKIQYTIQIEIGTPPQVIKNVILDTGSSVFAVQLKGNTTIDAIATLAVVTASFALLVVFALIRKNSRPRRRLQETAV